MARQLSLPQDKKIVQMLAPQTTNAALTSQVLNTKNASKVTVVFEFNNAAGFASAPTLAQATTLAAGTNKAGPSVPIWANEDTAASDTLVKQPDAASYTMTANIKKKQIVFEVDPSRLDVNNGYQYIYFTIASSAQASNFVSATAYVDESYHQSTPPTHVV